MIDRGTEIEAHDEEMLDSLTSAGASGSSAPTGASRSTTSARRSDAPPRRCR